MIKCEVIENFTLEKFNELKNVNKVISRKDNEFGVKDTFECDKEMADYLLGNNVLNKTVVKVIEVQKITKVKTLEEAPQEDALTKEATNAYLDDKPIKPKKKKTSKK